MNDIQDQINSLFQRLKSLDPKERISILSSLKDSLEFSEPHLFPPLTGNDEGSKEDGIPCAADNHQAEGVKVRTKLLPFQRKRFTLSSHKLISRQEETPSRFHVGRTGLTLSCPVCGLKATTWQKFSNHLHTGHSSAVISVCRRCNGIFKTRALLLAHECFLWGRKNLPCSAVYSSIDQSSRFLKKFGFPDAGIYFERRCGLCPASDVTFSSYEQFERHKYEEHADSNCTPPPFDTRRRKGLVFQGPPGQRLSRTLQNRFACSSRPTGLQRPSKRALRLTHASAAARMTATTTATKQLFLTCCAERVVVHVHPIDRDREPTETHHHHHPSTLPSVDSIEETAEVPAHTDHVCQVCSTSFTTVLLLQEHIKSEHCPVVEEDVEACQTPSKSTEERPEEAAAAAAPAATTISLVGALEQEDTGSPDKAPEEAGEGAEAVPLNVVLCKLCRISFRNSEFLQRHERNSTQHAKKMKMLAKVRARMRKSQLNRQIASGGRADTATHVYCCTDCGLTYARKQSLDRHISVVHHQEATFVCEYCDFEATDRTTFSEHMARHFHLKDVACEFCNHRCISKRELKDHILFKHQDERSYACSICAKTFKTAGTLSRHRRTHTGISFTCELCSAKFNRQSNLTRHIKTVHPSGTIFRKRRGRRRATPATDSPSAGGPSPLPPIRPKSTSFSTTTEVVIPTAVESEATGVTDSFGAIMDCNALRSSDASVPVEVAGFVSMAQDGGLHADLSSQDLPQTSQPAAVAAATSKPVYFVACNPTAMSSFSSSVNAHFTSFSSVSFPSAEEHTSLEVDGQNRDVDVDSVSRSLTADQGGTCHAILDSPSPSHNEGPFGCLDPLQKTSDRRAPGNADGGGHFSGLPCVSDFFFDAHTTTTTPSVFGDGGKDAVHVCFSSHLAPISSCSGTSSRPIWRPLDDLQPQIPLSDAPSLFSSSSAAAVGTFTTSSSDNFRVAFGDPRPLHHEYSVPDGSLSYTTAGSLGFPPSVCTPISPGGGIADATVSSSQPSPTCWQKSGSPGGGGDDDLHCTLFEDSADQHQQQQQQSAGGVASDFFVIPSSSLRIAKFSDMLPSLNSGSGGGHGCGVVETMVEAASSSVDAARNNHTDFSVGYLIGGEGSAAVGGGCDDCYGAMTTALQVSTHSTLTVSSSAFGSFFSSGGLPSLPTSDCLSLIPISSNFEDLSNTTDFSCNGYLL